MVLPNEQQAEITIRQVLTGLVQLNERQAYTYSQDELIGMLDEALATAE